MVRFFFFIQDPQTNLISCHFLRQSGDPAKRARAIVQAVSSLTERRLSFLSLKQPHKVTHFNNPKILAEVRTRFDSNTVFPIFDGKREWT